MEPKAPVRSGRLTGLDALRGTVMILMALDHIRDFFHHDAALYQPTDLTRTMPFLFFTRWITHFCMPVFMFSAGAGAYLWQQRGGRGPARGTSELAKFLALRGLWFLLLEVTVMQFAYDFNFSPENVILLLVLYIFGACMLLMAGLVYLPPRWLAIVAVVIVVLHNLLDPIKAAQFGSAAWMWNVVHQPGFFTAMGRGMVITYPLLPWIGVMACGFCFGPVLTMQREERRRWMSGLGWGMIALFFVLRAINVYGDPSQWSSQKSLTFTILSFFNCTKYPASLDYVLMTIGPAMLLLAWYEKRSFSANNPLVIFGRVPLFYFILHFYAIHLLLVIFSLIQYGGRALRFAFHPIPSMAGSAEIYPPNFGYPLWVTYAVWIGIVAALYPLCRWYAGVKARSRSKWLSYL